MAAIDLKSNQRIGKAFVKNPEGAIVCDFEFDKEEEGRVNRGARQTRDYQSNNIPLSMYPFTKVIGLSHGSSFFLLFSFSYYALHVLYSPPIFPFSFWFN